MKLSILALQISPYHDARFVGALGYFEEVHVVSTMNEGDFDQFLAKRYGKYSIHKICRGRADYLDSVSDGSLTRRVIQTLDVIRPDAIAVAGWTTPESLAALDYARRNCLPIVVMSESQADDSKRTIFREFIKSRIVSQFDAALVGGNSHLQYVEKLGIPQRCICLGYNAVDNQYFARRASDARADAFNQRSRLGLPSSYLLASARFIPKKNLPTLIRAYAAARHRLPEPPDLVLLGDGPDRHAILKTVLECGIGPNVHLPGFQSYNDIPVFYGLSKGFVHVSTVEQWGLVINEAMAAGAPVIASRTCGAARTLIEDGVSGILTDTDAPSISDALVSFCQMPPEDLDDMGRAAAEAISKWGPDRFGAGMRAAVEVALGDRRRGKIALWDRAIIAKMQRRIVEDIA